MLMSGGVDSSVTAFVLKEAGWNITGITMRLPVVESCDFKRSCCGVQAAYVCRDLDIPHYFLDVREEFRAQVIEPFQTAYAAGWTPSPCVECNTVFKFGVVWDFIEREMCISKIATGHYAQVKEVDGRWSLLRGAQKSRDQSYFLYGIKAARLKNLVLPLGGWTKEDVRRRAADRGLRVAERQDSMELCFAGEGDYRNALGAAGREPGNIVNMQGAVIGRHTGIANFTHGQRRGLGVAATEPLYVLGIRPDCNEVVAGVRADAMMHIVEAGEVNVLDDATLREGARLLGKVRSGGDPMPCRVESLCEVGDERSISMTVRFDLPLFAPTPGQKLVLYDNNERLIAGGTIHRARCVPASRRGESEPRSEQGR